MYTTKKKYTTGKRPEIKKNLKKIGMRSLVLASLVAVTAGCSNETETEAYQSAYTAEDVNPKLAASMNRFALDFYTMLEQHPGEKDVGPNRMISPAGIAMALSMLKAGAEGETKRQMDEALRLNGMSLEDLAKGQMILRDLLRGSDPSVHMAIANSLWSREGFELNKDYVSQIEKSYGAQVQALDFSKEQAVNTMNQWASDNTAGKIPKVIEAPLSDELMLLLMNAMYFKGDWTEPFEKEQTKDLPFHTEDGEAVDVPTMHQSGDYDYLDEEGFQAIRLPYGESKNFGMILALPDEDRSLDDFKRRNLPEFEKWSKDLTDQPGIIELPRFKLSDKLELNDALSALGMPAAFDDQQAELGGLAASGADPGELYVDFVTHDTFVEVNEEGTEAAAVTVIGVEAGSAPPAPFELKLNRPFFFAITDRTTGLIVFMGEVGNPLES
ncbi:serpin family protein [Saccharibacillus kuerlensis]|uniref:Serine protease inhibitor n=1 Tax=Saccharibacillus kuerlensis TaxID=459527 RepID=A0ABQ2KWU3_9BACL|nr:serpin family protein [Saccharibacillus kuerlensis]GGN95712.1 serine protease inhibitor [Saccharibacillus kuerlensis]